MSRAGLPPPGMHSKTRACPSSQNDSERGHLCWMNLKGMVDATCFSASVSQISAMLVYHLNAWPSGSCLLIAEFASLLFTPQRAFPFCLFCFALLYCLVPPSCLISPITAPIQIETGALTLHPPCTRHCAKRPTYLVTGLQTSEISLY